MEKKNYIIIGALGGYISGAPIYYRNKALYMNWGFPVYYMVLSNRRLRDAELCQINNVRVGPGMIKIRYNKKNYERLLSIVPSRIALSLQAQFKDIPPKRFNFCL